MKLLWSLLSVLVLSAQARHTVTELRVQLGQNVTLTCKEKSSDTFWYMKIDSQVSVPISHSVNNDVSDSQYFVHVVRVKYLAFGKTLVILGVEAGDCRLYFCGRMIGENLYASSTFRLVSDVPDVPDAPDQQNHFIINGFVIFGLLSLHVVTVIGLVSVQIVLKKMKMKMKNCYGHLTDLDADRDDAENELPPPAASAGSVYFIVQSSSPGLNPDTCSTHL